ncbi:hypothetical protein GCM10023238_11620 [Streptomyces heliomycini]
MSKISFGVEGVWSDFASEEAPDSYELSISRRQLPEPRHREHVLSRRERFVQHPCASTESSVELTSGAAVIHGSSEKDDSKVQVRLGRMVSALHHNQVLPFPDGSSDGKAIREVRDHLQKIRVFDPDVRARAESFGCNRVGLASAR